MDNEASPLTVVEITTSLKSLTYILRENHSHQHSNSESSLHKHIGNKFYSCLYKLAMVYIQNINA